MDLTDLVLARALSLIMHEWGYTAEQSLKWLLDDSLWETRVSEEAIRVAKEYLSRPALPVKG